MDADSRPEVSELHQGYVLTSRADTMDQTHHNGRSGPELGERLLQTPNYRTDLDLLVVDSDGNPAAYGLFWHDPQPPLDLSNPCAPKRITRRRDSPDSSSPPGSPLLAKAGAERIKIVYEPDNPASCHLYRSVGFEPAKKTDAFAGKTSANSATPAKDV